MFTMTKAEALRIQAEQVEHYASIYGDHVRSLVAAATFANRLEDGVAYDVVTVNRCIPRGAAIELLIPEKVAHEAALRNMGRT